jgi:hypothetical protein
MRKVLFFTVIVELGTGTALIADPGIVVRLLLGADLAGVGVVAGRCFGVALVALALACWPAGSTAGSGRGAFRGMLAYNALIALYLVELGTVGRMAGMLLWPAAILHALAALALAWTGRSPRAP